MQAQRKFELVVPAYNEAKNLKLLVEACVRAAQKAGVSSAEFNLFIVNNGSLDDSATVLREIQQNPEWSAWITVVPVTVNQGYGFGIWSGLQATTAEVVGWSHADLQCDPANAFKAFKIVKEKPQGKILVKGVRQGRNWKDILVSRVFETVARVVLGLDVYEVNAQPKVFSRSLLSSVTNPPKTFAFDLYVLYCARKQNYRIETIPVLFPPRIHGVSNWAATFFGRYKTILGIVRYILDLAKSEGRL